MEKIRILVADDHPVFLEGLCRLLSEEKDIEVVARASDGDEAIKLAGQSQPDVAIIDVAMPSPNGIESAKQIKEVSPKTTILMVSAFDYESYMLASLRVGAAGYLLKNTPARELIGAVRTVYSGNAVFDMKALSNIMDHFSLDGDAKKNPRELHERELEVLRHAAKGMSNKAIALQLAISERTVQTHMISIFRKLGVNSRTEAVLYALRTRWLTPDDLP